MFKLLLFLIFKLKMYSFKNVLFKWSIVTQYSDSVFLQINSIRYYYKIMAIIPCAIQYVCVTYYFTHSSLYLLISHP